MNHNIPNPNPREYAQWLLASEGGSGTPSSHATVAVRVFETLRRSLSTLVGVNGFSVLLARALKLAAKEDPSLKGVQVRADGSLSGLDEYIGPDASIGLVAHLLHLLITFMGEGMTLQVLRDAWPELARSQAVPSRESENDATR